MKYAPFSKRLSAWLIDMILFIIISNLLVYLNSILLHLPEKFLLSTLFVSWMIYNALSLAIAGNTIGQLALGIKVIDQHTQKNISVYKAFLRQVPLLAVLGLFFIFPFEEDKLSMPYLQRKKYVLQAVVSTWFVLDNMLCLLNVYRKTIEDALSGGLSIDKYKSLTHLAGKQKIS